MSKLLKEAIADAKAVRETALANARLALEEAFAPRLQSMLTKKLREEEAELDGVEDEVEVSDEVEEGSYHEDDVEVDEPSAEDEVEEGMRQVEKAMRIRPKWASDLPLDCEGGFGDSYGAC